MVFHKSYRDMVLRLNDLPALENAFLTVSDGTLTIKWANEADVVLDRGAVGQAGEVKRGDEVPAEVTFSYFLNKFSDIGVDGALDTFYDIVTKTGDGATWTSTRANTDVHCVNIRAQLIDEDGNIEENIDMDDFFYTSIDVAEGDPSKITITGKALVPLPVIT